nr:predicted GPI-anchored protein 58 [Aegilops tauschii subsp. strangulata]
MEPSMALPPPLRRHPDQPRGPRSGQPPAALAVAARAAARSGRAAAAAVSNLLPEPPPPTAASPPPPVTSTAEAVTCSPRRLEPDLAVPESSSSQAQARHPPSYPPRGGRDAGAPRQPAAPPWSPATAPCPGPRHRPAPAPPERKDKGAPLPLATAGLCPTAPPGGDEGGGGERRGRRGKQGLKEKEQPASRLVQSFCQARTFRPQPRTSGPRTFRPVRNLRPSTLQAMHRCANSLSSLDPARKLARNLRRPEHPAIPELPGLLHQRRPRPCQLCG